MILYKLWFIDNLSMLSNQLWRLGLSDWLIYYIHLSTSKMPLQICSKATAAYEDIRNDKTTTNWYYHIPCWCWCRWKRFTLEYKDESKDFLSVGKTGSGGLKECVGSLKADQALFIYLRILVGNDELSQRAKFVLVSWCG